MTIPIPNAPPAPFKSIGDLAAALVAQSVAPKKIEAAE